MKPYIASLVCLALFAAAAARAAGGHHAMSHSPHGLLVYVGSYTEGGGTGIHLFRFDLATGQLTPDGAGPGVSNPSFLALGPGNHFLYAVNEVGDFEGKSSGAVTAFKVDDHTGGLTLLNQQPSGGSGPCHLVVDPSGRTVLAANYGSGSVAALPITADGSLQPPASAIQHHGSSVNPQRQDGPHAHCILLDPAARFAYAADLGLDQVLIYRLDATQSHLEPAGHGTTAPGAGPRHLAFSKDGLFLYVIDELNSTVTVFSRDTHTGQLTSIQSISTLPEGFNGTNYPAEVQLSPDGRFLYGSNRGHDSIVTFRTDAHTGRLTAASWQSTGGKNPRNFRIDPTGRYLIAANQDTNNVVVFRINPESGAIAPTGEEVAVPKPVCVVMMPAP